MSTALAIAGVTAVLRDRLNEGVVNHDVSAVTGSTVTVSTLAPDRVIPAEGTESTQLNIFLYQVSPNTGWRNDALPARDGSGRHRLTNAPLALDLHYLISAYGSEPLHREILLGYAMQLMHEYPVLTREMIRTALNPSPDVGTDLPASLRALADCGLADQVETLKITPQFLGSEELSKLWTATQSHFRPSAAYQVSVVLIEARESTRPSLPVLSRGERNPVTGRERGVVVSPSMVPPLPTLESVEPDGRQPVIRLGGNVRLNGHHLDGTNRSVRLRNDRFDIDETLAATGSSAADHLDFTVPAASAADFPVGVYDIRVRLVMPDELNPRTSNRLAAVIAPDITTLPAAPVPRDGNGDAQFTVQFTPALRPGQTVSLLMGTTELLPEPFVAPTTSLAFIARDVPAGASPVLRLRIDGVDSPIVDRSAEPPVFFDLRVTFS
ncbi:DUF4255 domain-containing protein [Nitrogeniibacter mangrovi]|uniref:DUF4255 domain-containing protein n=1 Tax=Nitrogeniibacter mangrovi TaxID=2016596 RepID=A0A6C1B1W7_9RHOO|nr:DUF4255 domain-containing protein [Nitrogeniibacter mangrovi]QID17621.1 DUF4255 domain-containing protein [Nitrogeniibacter mangrovi]